MPKGTRRYPRPARLSGGYPAFPFSLKGRSVGRRPRLRTNPFPRGRLPSSAGRLGFSLKGRPAGRCPRLRTNPFPRGGCRPRLGGWASASGGAYSPSSLPVGASQSAFRQVTRGRARRPIYFTGYLDRRPLGAEETDRGAFFKHPCPFLFLRYAASSPTHIRRACPNKDRKKEALS